MIVITALFFACGSDDNNNSETGEETEMLPISELAEDPDFIKFMELYYFDDTEIPDLQAANELLLEYKEQDLWDDMSSDNFERLAITFGYANEAALSEYLKELNKTQELLEKKYTLSQVDSLILNDIRIQVFDNLSNSRLTNIIENQTLSKSDYEFYVRAMDACKKADTEDWNAGRPSCLEFLYAGVDSLKEKYGYSYSEKPRDCFRPGFTPPNICYEKGVFNYSFELKSTICEYDCCLIDKCFERGEDYIDYIPEECECTPPMS